MSWLRQATVSTPPAAMRWCRWKGLRGPGTDSEAETQRIASRGVGTIPTALRAANIPSKAEERATSYHLQVPLLGTRRLLRRAFEPGQGRRHDSSTDVTFAGKDASTQTDFLAVFSAGRHRTAGIGETDPRPDLKSPSATAGFGNEPIVWPAQATMAAAKSPFLGRWAGPSPETVPPAIAWLPRCPGCGYGQLRSTIGR